VFCILIIIIALTSRKLYKIEKKEKHPKGKKFRRYGWEWPWDMMQLCAVCFFFYSQFAFWALLFPGMSDTGWIVGGVIFCLLTLLVAFLWFWISCTDPACSSKKVLDKPLDGVRYVFCEQCDAYYVGSGPGTKTRRKHCGFCKKCVVGYDHHCWFLNTCIGGWNYKLFVVICHSYLFLLLVQVIQGFNALITVHNELGSTTNGFEYSKMKDYIDDTYTPWLWNTFLIIAQILGCFQAFMLCALIFFHASLNFKYKMSTFSFLGMEYPDEIVPEYESEEEVEVSVNASNLRRETHSVGSAPSAGAPSAVVSSGPGIEIEMEVDASGHADVHVEMEVDEGSV